MLTNVKLTSFRCFEQLSVGSLGRINVIVGPNAVGKTSLLEGLRLLGASGHPMVLYLSALERGEYDDDEVDDGSSERVAVLRFAFHGRDVERGRRFVIEGTTVDGPVQVVAEVVDVATHDPEAPLVSRRVNPATGELDEWEGLFPEWGVKLSYGTAPQFLVPIDWSRATARRFRLSPPRLQRSETAISTFLRANAIDDGVLGRMWDNVISGQRKDRVIEAMRMIEPGVQDIDLRADPRLPFRSRVVVQVANGESASAPIGSFGEGATWLFALILAAVGTPGQMLLVDDIDAGLHHRIMAKMWDLVMRVAVERNIQIFATTHSIDCLSALRRVCNENTGTDDVRVIRLIRKRPDAVVFSAEELDIAIDGEIEVRG